MTFAPATSHRPTSTPDADTDTTAPIAPDTVAGLRADTSARSASARTVAIAPPVHRGIAPPALPVDTLVDIASGLSRAEDLWRPHVSHDPLSRTSVRLVATDAYEVWLLGWTQDQRVEFHDHGGANAAFVVLEGSLDEITLGVAGITTKHLAAGGVGTVPAGVVHDVVNPGRVDATSLHVYSNPLRTMTFYDADGEPSYTELVQQVPALITSVGQAQALHPARAGR
jgi:mannose-6-phosphate isomerase-like protein (cupin superfamily)